MPVATAGGPLPLERELAHLAIRAAMRGQTDIKSPVVNDESNLLAGAKVYKINCAVCHGLPKQESTKIARGLFPKPPQLFVADESVTDDEIGKIYWFVRNGVRLTGMPGFVNQLSALEMWQVSQLLKSGDAPPAEVQDYLQDK